MKCNTCKKEKSANDMRLGVCWDCAEAESIIEDGSDMDDKYMFDDLPPISAMQKLKYLIEKGWNNDK